MAGSRLVKRGSAQIGGGGGSSSFVGARAYLSAATQSIPHATATAVALAGESFDTDSLHSTVTENTKILLNRVGYWLVLGGIAYAAGATGERRVRLHRNGSLATQVTFAPSASLTLVSQVSDIIQATATTDYVELAAYQDSGGPLNIAGGSGVTTFLAVEFLGS